MKRILNSMALGAIVGATSGILIDSFNKVQDTKSMVESGEYTSYDIKSIIDKLN